MDHTHPTRTATRTPWRAIPAVAALVLALFAGIACRVRPAVDNHATWRAERAKSIGGPEGWTTLAGLHWLSEGTQTIGSGAACGVKLPAGSAPEIVGTLVRSGTGVRFEPAPGVEARLRGIVVGGLDLKSDAAGKPDELAVGRVRFWMLARGERRAIRVRDPGTPERRAFHGIPTHSYDARWVFAARWEPAVPPRQIRITDVTGGSAMENVAGTLAFEIDGRGFRLDALEDPEVHDLWVLFGDATSGHTTYGSGRFLHVPMPGQDGRTQIDFNRAYNPPCAFTRHATCPLPPRENWLPIAVSAGELAPGVHP